MSGEDSDLGRALPCGAGAVVGDVAGEENGVGSLGCEELQSSARPCRVSTRCALMIADRFQTAIWPRSSQTSGAE
jgi:hypothetical protein